MPNTYNRVKISDTDSFFDKRMSTKKCDPENDVQIDGKYEVLELEASLREQ